MICITCLPKESGIVFASGRFILETALRELNIPDLQAVQNLPAGSGLYMDFGCSEPVAAKFFTLRA